LGVEHYICLDRIAEQIIQESMPSKYSLDIPLTEPAELKQQVMLLEGDVKLLLHKLQSGAIQKKADISRAYMTIRTKQNDLFRTRVRMKKLRQ